MNRLKLISRQPRRFPKMMNIIVVSIEINVRHQNAQDMIPEHLTHAASSWWEFDDIPINAVYPILAQLKKALPKMRAIWENSAQAVGGLRERLDNYIDQFEIVNSKLQSGELTRDDIWPPELRIRV